MIPPSPPQENPPAAEQVHGPHLGVQMLGEQGAESRKAFFIEVEPHPGQEEEEEEQVVVQMLRDIRSCVGAGCRGSAVPIRFS